MENHLVSELKVAAARGDVFGFTCPRKARNFGSAHRKVTEKLLPDTAECTAFVVIDGVKGRHQIAALEQAGFEPKGLFSKDSEDELLAIQPVLLEISDKDGLNTVLNTVWGQGVGIFLQGTTQQAVVRQLQSLLFAEMPNGDIQFLRFYDPAALEQLYYVLEQPQRATFFGRAISMICTEVDGGLDVLCIAPEASE